MPKRIIDGEGIWKSDKIAQVEPERYRGEYANLLPLALATGTFECNPRAIWATVYGYNRPNITPEDVAAILDEFERVKLLFRWTVASKAWGFWVGIDKPGRLPSEARQRERHEKIGEIVPHDKLRDFLGERIGNQPETIGKPIGSLGLGSGVGSGPGSGLGNGSGNGSGFGLGSEENPKSTSKAPENQNLSNNRKAEIQEQSQHRQLLSDAINDYRHTYGKDPDDKAFGVICQKKHMTFDYGKTLFLEAGQGR